MLLIKIIYLLEFISTKRMISGAENVNQSHMLDNFIPHFLIFILNRNLNWICDDVANAKRGTFLNNLFKYNILDRLCRQSLQHASCCLFSHANRMATMTLRTFSMLKWRCRLARWNILASVCHIALYCDWEFEGFSWQPGFENRIHFIWSSMPRSSL